MVSARNGCEGFPDDWGAVAATVQSQLSSLPHIWDSTDSESAIKLASLLDSTD